MAEILHYILDCNPQILSRDMNYVILFTKRYFIVPQLFPSI